MCICMQACIWHCLSNALVIKWFQHGLNTNGSELGEPRNKCKLPTYMTRRHLLRIVTQWDGDDGGGGSTRFLNVGRSQGYSVCRNIWEPKTETAAYHVTVHFIPCHWHQPLLYPQTTQTRSEITSYLWNKTGLFTWPCVKTLNPWLLPIDDQFLVQLLGCSPNHWPSLPHIVGISLRNWWLPL